MRNERFHCADIAFGAHDVKAFLGRSQDFPPTNVLERAQQQWATKDGPLKRTWADGVISEVPSLVSLLSTTLALHCISLFQSSYALSHCTSIRPWTLSVGHQHASMLTTLYTSKLMSKLPRRLLGPSMCSNDWCGMECHRQVGKAIAYISPPAQSTGI